jgi:hypothetical protein
VNGSEAATSALRHLVELTGKEAESVVGLESGDDGQWRVEIEAVELRRIPSSTDLLAIYEVAVDGDGELMGCRRLRRYPRGARDEEE